MFLKSFLDTINASVYFYTKVQSDLEEI